MFPFGFINWAPRQKQEQGLRITDRIRVARGYFEQETRALRRRSGVSITNPCGNKAGTFRRETCCERFGTFAALGDLERLACSKLITEETQSGSRPDGSQL